MENRRETETHGGHRIRMKQRVLSEGFEGLSPHELIEFLLYYAIPRQDVNALAHRLIDRFGSAREVLAAAPAQLQKVEGVGARTAKWLALVGEAAFASERLRAQDRPALKSCLETFRYAVRVRGERQAPSSVQLCLDGSGRLLFQREICPSLSWGEPDTLREALRDMIASQARGSILLLMSERHCPEPEDYDAAHAQDYAAALRAADCELMDVLLVGEERFCSLRKSGAYSPTGKSPAARALHENYMLDMPAGELWSRDYEGEEPIQNTNDAQKE